MFGRTLVRVLPAVPKPVVHRLAQRYIAGTEIGDALAVVRELNAQGKTATVTVLGEELLNADETRAIADAYTDVLQQIARDGLDTTISVKPTALGLKRS